MFLELLAGLPLAVLLIIWLRKDLPPLLGVYAQPGKWFHLKKALGWILLSIRKYKHVQKVMHEFHTNRLVKYGYGYARQNQKTQAASKKSRGYGSGSHAVFEDMDLIQSLPDDKYALDAMYFNAMHRDGTIFVLRIGRRQNRQAELWLTIYFPDIGVLQYPGHPDTAVYNTDGTSFSAGGLKLELLEPHRRWKIKFNGLLRKGLCNEWTREPGDLVHVKFSFIWEAYTDVFNFDTDMCPALLADALAREPWSREFFDNLKRKHQTHYEQWGEMLGVLQVEGQEEKKLQLRSCRDHSFGIRDWRSFHRYVVHLGFLEDGTVFHVSTVSMPGNLSFLKTGYLVKPNAVMCDVTGSDMNMPMLGENRNPPDEYSFNFTAGGKSYAVSVSANRTANYYHGKGWGSMIFEKMCTYTVNGVKGYGIAEFCYRYSGKSPVPEQESVTPLFEVEDLSQTSLDLLTVPFTQPSCTSSKLVGGKGCQLALLTQMNNKDFIVPQGFCLTITAFHKQLQLNKHLQDQVEQLEAVACQRKKGSIQDECERTVAQFLETPVASCIQQSIAGELVRLYKGEHDQKRFAVRSSAAGEDSEDMSAAGQMETYLGVKGFQQMFDSVVKCWASHFTFQAVEYRRQHGQPIMSSMGVVVQEMVTSQASGVLFTRDPLTGNPASMTLNANYGLGESVVSGISEPDTITISRSWNNQVKVMQRIVGSKKTQVNIKAGGGTEEMEVKKEEASKCCIHDEICTKLVDIGIQLEKAFGNPRDIEWAVHDGKIYLLQARPITTFGVESEWELMHEFDTPMATDHERLTTGNIGEMMPSAMTPLTITTFYRSIELGFQDILMRVGLIPKFHHFYKFMQMCCNHAFINLHYQNWLYEYHVAGTQKKVAELALLGETLQDFTMEDVKQYQGVSGIFSRLRHGLKLFKDHMATSYGRSKHWEEVLAAGYKIGDHEKAEDLYKEITQKLPDYFEGWIDPFANSSRSGLWSTILMSVLSQGKPDWKTEHYSDVAMLLGSCDDVYSADVPTALQDLAVEIHRNPKAKDFSSMPCEDAVSWLQSDASGMAGEVFKRFLRRHGHRCVREGDFYEKSWQTEPTKVVSVLQSILKGPDPTSAPKKRATTVEESIAQLKCPTTWVGRQVLRLTLPRARAAVGSREWGKSISVEMSEVFKQAWWRLARMMVHEGRLPDEEVLFFLTHYEIGQLLRDCTGTLIAKAQRRKKLYHKQVALAFPRFSIGHPQPVDDSAEEDFVITSVTLQGMPVSQGYVKGTARVVKALKDAGSILPGEVLIVKYTDVGWTPYFPLISGLVTEIGGLLSHGAVVAREYGIPCVVNMQKATTLFKSGDTVILNATKGTLEKVEV